MRLHRARQSLHLSKCHIVGNLIHWLIFNPNLSKVKKEHKTRTIYNLLNKATDIPAGKSLGIKKYKFEEEEEWGKLFSYPFKITKDSSVQWFQSSINHTILSNKHFIIQN